MTGHNLKGRRILITGASSGLGRHFALTLAREGARLALAARRVDLLESLSRDVSGAGGEAVVIRLDVTSPADIEAAVAGTVEAFGGIDILINNSGVAPSDMAIDVTEETWDRVMDTNLKGAWLMSQAAARAMIEGGNSGNIINIASVLAIRSQKGTTPYGISKAGLVRMTKSLALEWARYGIRVNAIAPGYFATDIAKNYIDSDAGQRMVNNIPQRRYGSAEDLDGVLLLLAGDGSRYMTGVCIPVDGGHSLALP